MGTRLWMHSAIPCWRSTSKTSSLNMSGRVAQWPSAARWAQRWGNHLAAVSCGATEVVVARGLDLASGRVCHPVEVVDEPGLDIAQLMR